MKEREETIKRLELLKAIPDLERGLKATAWYKRSERRDIKLRVLGLSTKWLKQINGKSDNNI
ncbi:MAG: hypothetical protein U9N61_02175 [Euryarchaeota archaeon]|nr:hypothetical protein [Euryarchaeota archaeon]